MGRLNEDDGMMVDNARNVTGRNVMEKKAVDQLFSKNNKTLYTKK